MEDGTVIQPGGSSPNSPQEPQEPQPQPQQPPKQQPDDPNSINWTASEYVDHERPFSWYFLLLFSSVVIAGIIFLVTEDIITTVAILVVAMSAGFFASRPPTSKSYQLTPDSLKIDSKEYDLGTFKSFSIVEEGAIDSIWLKPLGRFAPFLVIYFEPKDEEKIANILNEIIPYEPRELDSLDRLSRKLRF